MILKSINNNLKKKNLTIKYFYILKLLKLYKFMKLPKYFLNHAILTTNMKTPISNTKFIISMKLRKLFVSINIERTWLNKEKLDKNTSIYQNLIAFSWASLTFKKKNEKHSEITLNFYFYHYGSYCTK